MMEYGVWRMEYEFLPFTVYNYMGRLIEKMAKAILKVAFAMMQSILVKLIAIGAKSKMET